MLEQTCIAAGARVAVSSPHRCSMLTCPDMVQALAVKHVRDTFTLAGKWNLTAFLQRLGCPTNAVAPPATEHDFAVIRAQGLKQLKRMAQHGRPVHACG